MNVPLGAYWELLAGYLRPQARRVVLLGVLLLVGIGLELAGPQVLRLFVDAAVGGEPIEVLVRIAALFLVVALLGQLAGVAETYLAEDVGLTATNHLRADLMLHVLRLDPPFHAAHPPGALIERVDGDVTTLGTFFARLVTHVLANGLLMLGIVVLLFQIDWRIGAAVAVTAVLLFVAVGWLRARAAAFWVVARQASADLFGFIEERLAGTEDVRANGAVGYVLRRLHGWARAQFWAELRARTLGSTAFNTALLLLTLGMAASLGVAAQLYVAGAITIGTVYLVFHYAQSLNRPIEQIMRQMQDLQQATAGIGRVRDLLATRSAVQDPAEPRALPATGPLSVELDRVEFAYGSDEPALRGVSLRLEPGRALGLLGRTGSGKTTIARLLFRLYDPRAGAVRVGGVDLRDAALEDLRRRVGMVTQEIQLFHGSVRDNLTFFDRSIPDERILAVLTELGLDGWLASLPRPEGTGLATRLAPGGSSLSAGEAQLLAFARVFLRDPGLVVLDEASSRLDPATERRLERAVDRLLAGRTAVVIAHRLATVQRCDELLILDGGRVAEHGPRASLAADPDSHFAGLLRTAADPAALATGDSVLA